jgi:probable F420-dependent oxidoreductase
MTSLRVGVQVQPQHADFEGMRRAWREAEEMGVDSIFCWDHFYPLSGEPDGKHFEGISTLAALACETTQAQVGGLVFCNAYRNPELLADAHRTIDHISGGRAILGIGAGWFQRDFDEYGYEFGTAPDRVRALRDALPRIKSRLARLNPPPLRLPLLIGGSGPKVTLKLVAQYADMWHSFGDLEAYKTKNENLLGHCQNLGRDPAEIERCWGIIGDDLDRHAAQLVEAGVQHLIVGVGGDGHGYDLSELARVLEWRG